MTVCASHYHSCIGCYIHLIYLQLDIVMLFWIIMFTWIFFRSKVNVYYIISRLWKYVLYENSCAKNYAKNYAISLHLFERYTSYFQLSGNLETCVESRCFLWNSLDFCIQKSDTCNVALSQFFYFSSAHVHHIHNTESNDIIITSSS